MAADESSSAPAGAGGDRAENRALQEVLAAEHVAVWGYGVVGAAEGTDADRAASTAEAAHRDLRDQVAELLDSRKVDPVPAKAAYALPFPILSAHDAASLS